MILTLKRRINPSAEVIGKLWDVSDRCTELWNAAVFQRRIPSYWGTINKYTQKKELPAIKKAFPEFKRPCSQTLQHVILSLDRGYRMFFTKCKRGDTNVRPPKYRKRSRFFTQEYPQRKTSFALEGPALRLAYGSSPKDWMDIPVPLSLASLPIRTVQVSYKNRKWFACFTFEAPCSTPIKAGHTIWFDPGSKMALTGIKSDGTFVEYDLNPFRAANRETYRLLDQLMSRRDKLKVKGSYQHRRLKQRIQKLFQKLNTRTKLYLHALSKRLLRDHPDVKAFRIGDWDKLASVSTEQPKFVNQAINRAVQNNLPLMRLIGYLSYKAKLKGQSVSPFDERGTTRTCTACGHVHPNGIDPSVRVFVCERCGFTYPRDHHSCLNFIKKFHSALWQRLVGTLPTRSVRTVLHPFTLKPQIRVVAL